MFKNRPFTVNKEVHDKEMTTPFDVLDQQLRRVEFERGARSPGHRSEAHRSHGGARLIVFFLDGITISIFGRIRTERSIIT